MSEKMTSQNDLNEIKLVPFNKPHIGEIFKLVIMSCVVFLITIMLQWNFG